MKNFEKYKTIEECDKAHLEWCYAHATNGVCNNPHEDVRGNCIKCALKWMLLDDEEAEEPMDCPFCGKRILGTRGTATTVRFVCDCGYSSRECHTIEEAIANHNRICRAVRAPKESEVK